MFKKSNEEKESQKNSEKFQQEEKLQTKDDYEEVDAMEVSVEEAEEAEEAEDNDEKALRSPEEIQEQQQERIRELELALKKEQEEALQYCDALKRQQAEFANYKKRMDRERDKDRKFAVKEFALDLLQVVDNLERALEAQESNSTDIYKGVELVLKQFKDVLKKNSIEEEFPLHEPYDVDFHEVILKEESDEHESDTVIEVFQKGYKLHGKILRPAMVKIAK